MNKKRHKAARRPTMGLQDLVRSPAKSSTPLSKCIYRRATFIVILLSLLAGSVSGSSQQQASVASSHTNFQNKSELSREAASAAESRSDGAAREATQQRTQAQVEKEAFVVELLKALHEQYGRADSTATRRLQESAEANEHEMQERRSFGTTRARMLPALLEAIGPGGDMRRLVDWIKDSFNPASIAEVSTQFVVSKLGSVNCAALLRPDKEESLIPRFLLFNEHHLDVPFELPIKPTATDCIANAKFDPARKTVVIVHGYLGGYTLIDGLTNIKNRLLDLNRFANEQAIAAFLRASQTSATNSSYVFTDDLSAKIRAQLYNVIIVDWFNGANPSPRANYIRAAVNAQLVGKLIARFLSALVVQCGAPAEQLQIIAHSLGCHVSGFAGKAMNAAGHRLGKITHLDPVGLCFGRLFSERRLRLAPNDALETEAVHTSLNIFDNPLDGAHSNFLVNGGRDQPGCGNQNEVTNSTTTSVALLWDPAARFSPCSHLRALALFEDDHSSAPGECQFVGYRCSSYDRFLAGKCAFCDSTNAQCRLMGLAPLALKFQTMTLADKFHYDSEPLVEPLSKHFASYSWRDLQNTASELQMPPLANTLSTVITTNSSKKFTVSGPHQRQTTTITTTTTTRRPARSLELASAAESTQAPALERSTVMFGQPAYFVGGGHLLMSRRSGGEKRERISQAIERLRADTRRLAWTRGGLRQPLDETTEVDYNNELDESPNSPESSASTPAMPNETRASSSIATYTTTTTTATTNKPKVLQPDPAAERLNADEIDETPLGGQPIPAGSINGPLYFLGASSMSPFCVNYYQVRVLIAESRLLRILAQTGLASNRLRAQYNLHAPGSIVGAAVNAAQRNSAPPTAAGRDMLHLTVKLTDSLGHFFKGFSVLESVGSLARVMNDFVAPASLALAPAQQAAPGLNEPLLEVTMLLNSTRARPTKVAETIISYYFHPIVLADRVEINFMSNISPDIRAKYSSVLCPVAINDRHQLVKYAECHRVSRRRRRK